MKVNRNSGAQTGTVSSSATIWRMTLRFFFDTYRFVAGVHVLVNGGYAPSKANVIAVYYAI